MLLWHPFNVNHVVTNFSLMFTFGFVVIPILKHRFGEPVGQHESKQVERAILNPIYNYIVILATVYVASLDQVGVLA